MSTAAAKSSEEGALEVELAEELRQADEDFALGDFIELTIDDLDRCVAAGEWPWQRASSE